MYEGTVAVSDLPALRAERTVTQVVLVEGRNHARLYERAGSPPRGFERVPATLEDAYLVLMRLGSLPGRAGAAASSAAGSPAPATVGA